MAGHGQAAGFFLIEHFKRPHPLALFVPVLVAVSSEVANFASPFRVDPGRRHFRRHDLALIQQGLPVSIIHQRWDFAETQSIVPAHAFTANLHNTSFLFQGTLTIASQTVNSISFANRIGGLTIDWLPPRNYHRAEIIR